MKDRTCASFLALAAMLVWMLCVPMAASAKSAPNPEVPAGYKTTGPHAKGTIIAGWKWLYNDLESGTPMGEIAVYLIVEGHPYYGIITDQNGMSLSDFEETEAVHITGWDLPTELAALYNLREVSLVKVLDTKDVVTGVFVEENTDPSIPYDWILSCEVKITFLTLLPE